MSDLEILNQVFDRYEQEVLPELAPRTQRDYRRHLKILRAHFGDKHPDAVRPKDVGQFLGVPRGKIQRNRQVAVLSAIYSYAVGRWWAAERNPCLGVLRNPSKKRTRYITDDEFLMIYREAPERVRIIIDLAFVTGQRQGDILALRWDQVTPDGIRLQEGKTGKKLLIGLSPTLEAILARAKRLQGKQPSEYVNASRNGIRYSGEGFRACYQRVMRPIRAASLIEKPFPTFHDLRAKCVSDSKSLEEAFERSGHTTMAMTRGTYDRNFRKVTPLL